LENAGSSYFPDDGIFQVGGKFINGFICELTISMGSLEGTCL
jgi:hypothetical protein